MLRLLTSPNILLDEILAWQSAPDRAVWFGRESIGSKVKRGWPRLKSNLDNDEPTILALIREEGYLANLTNNHQVLAIGYTYHPTTQDLKIHVEGHEEDEEEPPEIYGESEELELAQSQGDAS